MPRAPRDRCGELPDHCDGLTVLAQYQHVVCEVLDRWVIEEDSTDVVEGGDHRGLGE